MRGFIALFGVATVLIATAAEPTPAERQELARQAAEARTRALALFRQSKFADAEKYGREALALREKLHPQGHTELAQSINELATILSYAGKYAEAEAAFQRSLAMREKLYPADQFPSGHREVAQSLNDLGGLLSLQKKHAAAEEYYLRALAVLRKIAAAEKSPRSYAELAQTLQYLGAVAAALGKADQAIGHTRECLGLLEKLFPADKPHPSMAEVHANLGELHRGQRDFPRALTHYQQALAIRDQLFPLEKFPAGQLETIGTLERLGSLHETRGDYAGSLACWQRILTIREKFYPVDKYPDGHPDLATALNNIGAMTMNLGNYTQAVSCLQRAVALEEKFGSRPASLAAALHNLAEAHQNQGEHAKALACRQRSIALLEKLYPASQFPQGHRDLAAALNNMSQALRGQGEYALALVYQQRALAMLEKLFPADQFPGGHPLVAAGLNNMSLLFRSEKNAEQALLWQQRTVTMMEKLYPADKLPQGHPDLATALMSLAEIHRERGDFDAGLTACRKSLAMVEKLYPAEQFPQGHPLTATFVNNLCHLLQARGDYAEAHRQGQRALAMAEKLYPLDRFPQGHPSLATILDNLGMVAYSRGNYAEAARHFEQAAELRHRLTMFFAAAASEAEVRNFTANQQQGLDPLLSASARLPESGPAASLAVWRKKSSLVLLLQGRQRSLAEASQAAPEIRALASELLDARTALARLLLSPADNSPQHAQRLADLTRRKETLERDLAGQLPAFRRHELLSRLGPDALARCLPARSAFVEILGYLDLVQDAKVPGNVGRRVTPRYVSFLILPGAQPQRIELGDGTPIHDAVAQWRRAIAKGEDDPAAAGALARLVWDPIAKHLPRGTQTVWLAPDSATSFIPWAALPTGPGRVLIEDYQLAIVPSGLFLLDRLTAKPRADAAGQLLLAGDVNYDNAPQTARATGTPVRGAWRGERKLVWEALPATRDEIEQVERLASPRQTLIRKGAEAGTAHILAALPKARWAHLATHGFFADAQFRSFLQLDESQFRRGGVERATAGARNPLVLSGLVLAGANRSIRDPLQEDGGILSAEVIAGLPLHELELAVLSACETGIGEVAGGEGVFGLQRAFHLGGAHNVVASLWKVDDQPTAALMRLFYHHLWKEGKPPLEALRLAQLTLYHHPERIEGLARERGPRFDQLVKLPAEPMAQPGRKAPIKAWAAFVLSGSGQPGQDRPLEPLAK